MRLFRRIYRFSLQAGVDYLRRRMGMPGARIYPPDVAFLRSPEYPKMMSQYVPWHGDFGLHEAQTYTRSYVNRHHTCMPRLGVFRWRGMQKHLDEVLREVADPNKYVVDFGGAGCPLGMHSVVVDYLKRDVAGRRVPYRNLSDLPRKADVVFAAHVLEHIPDLDDVLAEIGSVTVPGGAIIVLVPSFTNEGWRAGIHNNRRFGGHAWTFGLAGTPVPPDLYQYRNIDEALGKYFTVETAEYCGDDCIYLFCRNTALTPEATGAGSPGAIAEPARG